MSYPRTLDEIPWNELNAELKRRDRLLMQQRCTYCERPFNTSPCKFPNRHRASESPAAHTRYVLSLLGVDP